MKENHFHTGLFENTASEFMIYMGSRVKDKLRMERKPRVESFTPFYLWQYGKQVCHLHWCKE